MIFRTQEAEWVRWQSYPTMLAHHMPLRFLEGLTPNQRTILGFPALTNAYWTVDTIEAVGKRYRGMDMEPYKEALRHRM